MLSVLMYTLIIIEIQLLLGTSIIVTVSIAGLLVFMVSISHASGTDNMCYLSPDQLLSTSITKFMCCYYNGVQ